MEIYLKINTMETVVVIFAFTLAAAALLGLGKAFYNILKLYFNL